MRDARPASHPSQESRAHENEHAHTAHTPRPCLPRPDPLLLPHAGQGQGHHHMSALETRKALPCQRTAHLPTRPFIHRYSRHLAPAQTVYPLRAETTTPRDKGKNPGSDVADAPTAAAASSASAVIRLLAMLPRILLCMPRPSPSAGGGGSHPLASTGTDWRQNGCDG